MEQKTYQQLREKYKHLHSDNMTAILITLALTIAALGLIYYSSTASGISWFIAQLALGGILLQWFFLLHDLGHDHFFKNTTVNIIVGHLSSLFCILPFFPWKYIHRAHHLWTGWKDLDPTMTIIIPRKTPEWKKNLLNFCWKAWIPIFSLSFSFANFWNIKKLYRLFPHHAAKNAFSIFIPVAAHLALITHYGLDSYSHSYSLGFFVFLFLCDPLLLSQHSSIPQDHSQGKKVSAFHFREQDQYTRSLVFPYWMSKYFFIGFNNHIVHHLFPNIPGYLLSDIQVQNTNDENWWAWLKRAKKTQGFDLILSEENNLIK